VLTREGINEPGHATAQEFLGTLASNATSQNDREAEEEDL
jgi:hypothetical protein